MKKSLSVKLHNANLRKKKGRSIYAADPTAGFAAIEKCSPLVKPQVTSLGVAYWSALTAMIIGHGNEEHFHTLAAVINIGMVLNENARQQTINEEVGQLFIDAQMALMNCWRRHSEGKAFGFSGTELQQMRDALHHHDVQIKATSQRKMLQTIKEVIRRKEAGHVLEIVPVSV
jgi:hypothetical protein